MCSSGSLCFEECEVFVAFVFYVFLRKEMDIFYHIIFYNDTYPPLNKVKTNDTLGQNVLNM